MNKKQEVNYIYNIGAIYIYISLKKVQFNEWGRTSLTAKLIFNGIFDKVCTCVSYSPSLNNKLNIKTMHAFAFMQRECDWRSVIPLRTRLILIRRSTAGAH